jgi:iron complex outermembrane recepter protein
VYSKVAFAFAASLGTPMALALGHDCPVGEPLPPTHISIPAQPLNAALQALAAQTGLYILFEPATVAGLRAAAVRGEMQPSEALCLLLGDQGLVYSINADHTIIVSAGGRMSRAGSEARAVGPESLSLAGDTFEPAATSQVIVAGTRRTDRSVADSLAPIGVITGESLTQAGATDTAHALAELVPSFNDPQPSLTDGTDIVRPTTLRGLQPDEMLVLVNGKRRHSSALLNINTTVGRGAAGVDLSMLPAAAIDRVEVLRDDVGAQYGSDAIAGVVNVILKQQREGGDVSVSYGQNYTTIHGVPEATGVLTQPNGAPIMTPDGVYALRYNGEREAHDGQTVSISGNVGLPLGRDGFADVAIQGRDQAPANRAGYDPRVMYPATPAGLADPRELTFDRLSQQFGEPRIEDVTAVLNAGVPLGDSGAQWYAFGTYGGRFGQTTGFYRPANDPGTVTSIYPDGFLPRIKADVADRALASGVRGSLLSWNYDLSGSLGRDAIDFATENSDNAALGAASPTTFEDGGLRYEEYLFNLDLERELALPALGRPLSVAWGLESRAERFAIRPGDPSSYIEGQGAVKLGPMFRPGLSGAQSFPGFTPDNAVDQGRHSVAAYVDLEQDLTSYWTFAVAGRAEHYSDFGSTVNYKTATRVRLLRGLALRSSASTGFKAPSLQQQFFSTTSTNDVAGSLIDVGTFDVTDRAARALGATNLKPEKSRSLNAGVVFDRIDGLDISVDWYRIAIDDRIVLSDNLGAEGASLQTPQNLAVGTVLADAGYPSIQAARFFINGVDTVTRGLDVVSAYRVPLQRMGDLRFTAGFSDTQTTITRYLDNLDPQAQIPGLTLFGPLGSELLTRGQPGSKLNLGAEWNRRGLAATLRTNRYGSVLSPAPDPRDNLVIQPAWVTDVELRYSRPAWQVAMGAENVFDHYPTSEPTGARPASLGGYYDGNNYFVPYSVLSPFGFSGRYLYGRMSYRF